MGKIFRPGHRESSLLSKIESSKEQARRRSLSAARDHIETLGNAISMKLVENNLVETNNKNTLEEQIVKCIDTLCRSDDFDVDYMVAPYRQLVKQPNVVSLYVTAYLLEKLIDHKCIVDIYGSDNDIYGCINTQVMKVIPS
jgi:hypothetical protein